MEVRTMFWLIAGLIFVSMIILVGLAMSGQLMQMQTCSEEDIYYASDTFADDRGTYCGSDNGDELYCGYKEITQGVRGTFVEKDPCVNKEEHLCCRTCYKASGVYSGDECGRLDALHAYRCHSGDLCANEETGRCCRDVEEFGNPADQVAESAENKVEEAIEEGEDIDLPDLEGLPY